MYRKLDKMLTRIEEVILVIGILSAAGILFLNVILRYFFKSGIVWAEEYARYAIIWITFVGGSAAALQGEHLSVTALLEILDNKKQRILRIIAYILSILFTIFMVIWGMIQTVYVMKTGQRSPAMEIPAYLIYLAIPLGGFLMTIRFSQLLYKDIKEETGKEK